MLRKNRKSNGRSRTAKTAPRAVESNGRSRMCRFERMESRQMLSADFSPIQIGAVYFEDAIGIDAGGDLIEITWVGGAPNTQLTELIIDTDKRNNGELSDGDPFFDVDANPPGTSGSSPLIIDTQRTTGIDHIEDPIISVDGTKLVMRFTGFDPGDRLVFSVDVDEEGYPTTPLVEGKEFQYSRLQATFAAENYFDATGIDDFLDAYDDKLRGSGLELPADRYTPADEDPLPDQTAGAIFQVEQTLLPTIV
ncbi:MAG: hypothetical protein V3R99_02910, partial [Thermoguttaceae bacterium]